MSAPAPLLDDRSAGRPVTADAIAVVAVVAGVAAITVAWGRVFADGSHRLPTIVAAALGAGGAAVATRRLALGRATLSALAVPVALVGLAAWYAGAFADLPGDLVGAWKDAASVGLLLPTERRFVLVPVVLALAASWVAVVLALRGPAITVLVPLGLAHGATTAYTIERSPNAWWTAPLLVAVTAVVSAAASAFGTGNPGTEPVGSPSRPGSGSGSGGRRTFLAAAAVGTATTVLVGAAAFVIGDGDDGFDLRSRLERPLDIASGPTPLATLKSALIEDAPVAVFEIELTGLGPDDEIGYLPVAELDGYDGTIWQTGARFVAAGAALPLPRQTGNLSETVVAQRVSLTPAYPFAFVPRAGIVRATEGADLAWDERAGTMALVEGRPSDATDLRLEVQLPDLDVGPSPALEPVPETARGATIPPELGEDQLPVWQRFTESVSAGATTDYGRLVQLQDTLRSDRFGYNTEAASGHSLAALSSYLEPGAGADSVGFAEQSAAVFAIAARQLGAASRVVVGYRLEEPITAANPRVTVTEDLLHAWPEVWVDGVGWTRFEPTNTGNETTEQAARTPAVSQDGRAAPAADLPDLQEPVLIPDPEPAGAGLGVWAWPLGVVALGVLYLVGVVGWRRLRRLRRRRGGDEASTVGAWLEARTRLEALGLPAHAGLSPTEVVGELDVIDLRDVADPLVELAPMVDTALYAATGAAPPGSLAPDEAWRHSRSARRAAGSASPRGRRLRAFLDPRS